MKASWMETCLDVQDGWFSSPLTHVWVPCMLAPTSLTCVDTLSPQWSPYLSFTCVPIDLLLLARAPPFAELVPTFYRVDAVVTGLTVQSLGT